MDLCSPLLARHPEAKGYPNKALFSYFYGSGLKQKIEASSSERIPSFASLHMFGLSAIRNQTNARQSEIWGLRWQEIDLKDGFLKFEHTKNGDIRVVPVIGKVLDLLRGYHSQHRIVGRDELFPSRTKGKSLDLRTQWESALKQAEIEDFRWHDLRHSCASYMVRQGLDLRLEAELLGHRALQMAMRYFRLAKEHLKSAISEAMER